MLTYITRYMESNTYPLASDKARLCKPPFSKKRKSSEAKQKDRCRQKKRSNIGVEIR